MSDGTLERKLLSRMTTQKDIQTVWEMGLSADAFLEPINRRLFEFMIDYWQSSLMQHAPTWVVMAEEYPSVPLLAEVEESTEWLVDAIRRRWLINQGQHIIREATANLSKDPLAVLSQMWHESYEVTETVAPRSTRVDLSQNVPERREAYSRKNTRHETGMTVGLPELDTHTRGALPGELVVVAAFTKVGKSWWLAKTAVEARRQGHIPLLMTLEQGVAEMTERIDALHSGVSYARLQRGGLDFDEMRQLSEARDTMAGMGPFYVEKPQRGERTIKNMANRCRQLGADYLIIDQLSFIDAERDYRGDKQLTQKHGDLIFDLKDEINRESAGRIPCMLAVQFNRDTMKDKTTGGKGELYNFAHSSMIEQTADLCLALWRNPEMRNNNSTGLGIIGARRADLRDFLLRWELTERTLIEARQQ